MFRGLGPGFKPLSGPEMGGDQVKRVGTKVWTTLGTWAGLSGSGPGFGPLSGPEMGGDQVKRVGTRVQTSLGTRNGLGPG
jgi:hypothetical protein